MTDDFKQVHIGRDAAIAKYNSEWWVGLAPREAFVAQLNTAELMMPFGEFQRVAEEALGRPVFTHEFASPWTLARELEGSEPKPDLAGIMAKLGLDRIVVVSVE